MTQTRPIISTCLLAGIMLILVLCLPEPVYAVSTVTISSTGDGVFVVQGIKIEDAAALEITLAYDTAALTNPRVMEGPLITGAMTAVNTNIPGFVRMVIIRLTPVKGSGVLATLTFTRTGTSSGRITSLSARLANVNGDPLPVLAQVTNPPDASTTVSIPPQGQASPSGTASTGPTGAGTTAVIAPTVIIAGQTSRTDEAKAASEATGERDQTAQPVLPERGREPKKESPVVASRTPDTMPSDTALSRKIFAQKSVLERFGEYKGPRTAGAFLSLFEQNSLIGFRQEPPVALSDGKSRVTVTFISTPGNRTSSDVAVMSARLMSMRRDPDNTNTWNVELIPEKGMYQSSITVAQGEIMMVYSLTIAPKVDLARVGILTEADLNRRLGERGVPGTKAPALDMNGDGRRDHIDDYILIANYLAARMR